MNRLGRDLGIIALAIGLLVFQSALSTLVSLHPFTPNLILPIIIFLGVSPEFHFLRGAFLAFLLGYLLDRFCGNLMSVQTFVMVATYMIARGAGLRLFARGPAFQMMLTFFVCVMASGATLALRAIFERAAPFAWGGAVDTAIALAGPSLTTALAAPLIFFAVRRVDVARREEARAA